MKKEIEELYNEINNAIAKCDKCEDCEFYGEKGDCQNKRIAKALIDLGYRKTEVKTNGDNIRKLNEQNDDELANSYINAFVKSNSNNCIYYRALFTVEDFDTFDEAYEANLKWLKQDYVEE